MSNINIETKNKTAHDFTIYSVIASIALLILLALVHLAIEYAPVLGLSTMFLVLILFLLITVVIVAQLVMTLVILGITLYKVIDLEKIILITAKKKLRLGER